MPKQIEDSSSNSAKRIPLSKRCKDSFDSTIRHRGEHYFHARCVSEPILSDRRISATVMGTHQYNATMTWEVGFNNDEILVICTCPHYDDGFVCKHTWALILKIDQVGLDQTIPGQRKLFVVHKEDLSDEELDIVVKENPVDLPPPTPQKISKQWLQKIKGLQQRNNEIRVAAPNSAVRQKRVRLAFYLLDLEDSRNSAQITIHFYHQEYLKNGVLSQIKHERVSKEDLPLYTDPLDREIMTILILQGCNPQTRSYYSGGLFSKEETTFSKASFSEELQEEIIYKLARTGRLIRQLDNGSKKMETAPLKFDDGPPWRLELLVESMKDHYKISGRLFRDDERIGIIEPKLLLTSGLVVFEDHIARLDARNHFAWIFALRAESLPPIPPAEVDDLMEALYSDENCPPIQWPESLQWLKEHLSPTPKIIVGSASHSSFAYSLSIELKFSYGDFEIPFSKLNSAILDSENRRLILRDLVKEKEYFDKLKSVDGLNSDYTDLNINPGSFAKVIETLLEWGWAVQAFGKILKTAGDFNIKVTSGVDWFDLEANVDFDGLKLTLPRLLLALENQEHVIPLGDGTVGMLPTKWLEKYGALSKIGEETTSGLRFTRGQGALVAAWLDDDQVVPDADFAALMKALRSRTCLKSQNPRSSFNGQLRPYQKEGLAWLSFLSKVGFGGILADDMGLGKTVQVLAHLDAEYAALPKTKHRPSLIVLPKSLLFNWSDEAAKFVPKLKVLTYAGPDRSRHVDKISCSDIVLVTYSTLRQDIEQFRSYEFHYVITDEAQAIKNADSLSHHACRLMRGRHRLAMTGTPVENSALDLIAILNFVSPGLLGNGIRGRMTKAASHGHLDIETLTQLSKALRPFILRRTKNQVLNDLPEKIEKVLYCELNTSEMRQYHELRDHYRARLKGEFSRRGLARSKIVVLEALLRFRQASCHPGLIDKKRTRADSAKIETLVVQLKEIISEGHKALVFSQFTSFLDIVGDALKESKIAHVRLDGKTPDLKRQELVRRFQTESELRVFLISLKAGGVGLNLTAADYVFILDPWWNPAVETQAIDRSHRFGQKNKVIAYRLIAKDTVEEKIIELQKQKREIADAIISEDASLLKKLNPEDIEVLLS